MPEALRPATRSAVIVGPELANQRERHAVARERRHAKALELRGGVHHQHAADEKRGDHHDRQRAHADQVHLLERVFPILRRRENIRDATAGEQRIVLHDENLALERIPENAKGAMAFRWLRASCGTRLPDAQPTSSKA